MSLNRLTPRRDRLHDRLEDVADEWIDNGGQITVLPTVRHLHCRVCGHQGKVQHPPGTAPAFRCKRCGSRL